jgi:hypothetical protein
MKLRLAAAVAGVALAVGVTAGTASAGQPAVKGCLGESVSANAQLLHPYGQVVLVPNAPRNEAGSIGDAVHLVQAGLFPDELFPNTCNPPS